MAALEHMLELDKVWHHDGRLCASWRKPSRVLLHRTQSLLTREVGGKLSLCCMHLKGHGGVKGAVRFVARQSKQHRFVARFDVASYYDSIRHDVLLRVLEDLGASAASREVVEQYLRLPDTQGTGLGMSAGGRLSPLLAAVMLQPLDAAMQRLTRKGGLVYARFMDDFVILAKKRHPFRRAVKRVHEVMRQLHLRLHETKRFIGQVSAGFDFLGYAIHPARRLRPSAESLRRLSCKFRRFFEQGASRARLRQYVERWWCWFRGGLAGLVSRKGGRRRVFIRLLRSLDAGGTLRPDRPAKLSRPANAETSAAG